MGTFGKKGSKEDENRPNKSLEGGVQLDNFKSSGHFTADKNFQTLSTLPIAHCSMPIIHVQYLANYSHPLLARLRCPLQQWQVRSVIRFCANWHSGGLQWQSELDDVERRGEKLKCKSSFPR